MTRRPRISYVTMPDGYEARHFLGNYFNTGDGAVHRVIAVQGTQMTLRRISRWTLLQWWCVEFLNGIWRILHDR